MLECRRIMVLEVRLASTPPLYLVAYSRYLTVDLWAPGAYIPSLWVTSDTAVNTLSGNSMAAAHIAGLGAYFLALEGPRTAVGLCNRMREVATQNALSGIPAGTANLLAYNLSGL